MQNADLIKNIAKHRNFLSYIKMGKEILKLGDLQIGKYILMP